MVEQWRAWGTRIKDRYKDLGLKAGDVAEKMGVAESTLRSWLNGTRAINLFEFFKLCRVVEADPFEMLGAERPLTKEQVASPERTMRSIFPARPR